MARKAAKRKRSSRSAGEDAELELLASDESIQASQGPALSTPTSLVVINYRCRLCDADGVSAKAAIDGCVHRGLLPDDSAAHIQEVRSWQVKVGSQEQEKTLLVFIPIESGG
jgi:hypothetical protein